MGGTTTNLESFTEFEVDIFKDIPVPSLEFLNLPRNLTLHPFLVSPDCLAIVFIESRVSDAQLRLLIEVLTELNQLSCMLVCLHLSFLGYP